MILRLDLELWCLVTEVNWRLKLVAISVGCRQGLLLKVTARFDWDCVDLFDSWFRVCQSLCELMRWFQLSLILFCQRLALCLVISSVIFEESSLTRGF